MKTLYTANDNTTLLFEIKPIYLIKIMLKFLNVSVVRNSFEILHSDCLKFGAIRIKGLPVMNKDDFVVFEAKYLEYYTL